MSSAHESLTASLGHRGDDLLGYVGGSLDPDEKTELEAHLATCPECQAGLAFARKVRAAHDRQVAAKADRSIGGWLYRHAGAFALVAVAALVIVEWLQPGRHQTQPTMVQCSADGGDGG